MNKEVQTDIIDVIITLLSSDEPLPESVRIWCIRELVALKTLL